MAEFWNRIKKATELAAAAFDPDSLPDKEDLAFLEEQLKDAPERMKRNPRETVNLFRRARLLDRVLEIARSLRPLPDGKRSPMIVSTPGAVFPAGILDLAVDHFDRGRPLLLIVWIQSHCGVILPLRVTDRMYLPEWNSFEDPSAESRFGVLMRYTRESDCCGALNAVLEGKEGNEFLEDVEEQWKKPDRERIAKIPENVRLLVMAREHAARQMKILETEYHSLKEGAGKNLEILSVAVVNINGLPAPMIFVHDFLYLF